MTVAPEDVGIDDGRGKLPSVTDEVGHARAVSVRYAEHRPDPRLRAQVACYWTVETDGPATHLVLPDGCMDLLFDEGRAALVGTMTEGATIAHAGASRTFGVRFRPGEAFAFSRIAASEVRDASVGLREVWSDDELTDRIAGARDDQTRVAIVDHALLARRTAGVDRRVRRSVARLLARPATRIAEIAREVGISERQLERAFEIRVGLSPKSFARVARLHAAIRATGSWAERAAASGFADQAHLGREVKRLSGLTPTELARVVWQVAI